MPEKETHLLLVEDEAPLREATAERLAEHGYRVVQVESGEAAVEQLTNFAFDVLLTDLRLPGIDGTKVLAAALERYPEIVCIVVTGFGTVKHAVEAIKRGAAEFITKPFQFDQLLHVLARGARTAPAALRERVSAVTTGRALPVRGTGRTQCPHARAVRVARNGGRERQHGTDKW